MTALSAYQFLRDRRDRLFSLAVASSFAAFGKRSRLALPTQIEGADKITIGNNVNIGPGSWLLCVRPNARLEIGDGSSLSGLCVLSAAVQVSLGSKVLLGRNVHIADHRHGLGSTELPIIDQPLEDLRPVSIGDGAWLGQNVVVLPGVSIGAGAVVGANSVVREDVPARAVAVGVPARVVRELG